MGGVGDVVESVGKAVGSVVEGAGEAVGAVAGGVAEAATKIVDETGNVVATITESVGSFIDKVKNAVKSVVDKFKTIILEEIAKIKDKLSKIFAFLNKLLTLIEKLHTLVKIYYYTVRGEIHKAIIYVLEEVDKKLAIKVKEVLAYINEKITEVYRVISDVRKVIGEEVARIDARLAGYQTIFSDIADALDVRLVRDIGNGIRKFREDVLEKIRDKVEDTEKRLKDYIYVVTNPFVELYSTFLLTRQEYERYRHLFARLMLDSANSEILTTRRKKLSITIPSIIL